MIRALTLLLVLQLIGEVIARLFGLPIPGPVIGMVLMVGLLFLVPPLYARITETAQGVLKHLSLLFVPAAVGVMQHGAVIADYGIALIAALLVSTLATLAVTALTFRLVARLQRETR